MTIASSLIVLPANSQTQPESAQYYQNFQTVPVAAESTFPQPQPSTPRSISEPVWVVPGGNTPARVTVPPVRTAPDNLPPANLPGQPETSSDLVVTATNVQIVGANAELQQVIRRTIATQPGGGTNQIQLKQDIAAILSTGLFVNASYSTQTNSQGIDVTFRVEPVVVRSLRLSNAQALTPTLANRFFANQLGRTASPAAIAAAVQQTNQWYANNGYALARVLTVQPTRDGGLIVDVAEGLVGAVRVQFVDLAGNTVDANGRPIAFRTQPDFARRQILLQPGQVFREDVARADVQRLVALGVFERVTLTFAGDARRTDVVYNVVESKSRGFNFGAGVNNDLGLFGTINYQDSNFGGLAQRVNGSVQVGTRDVQFDGRFISPYRATDPSTPGYGANVFRRQGLSRVFSDEIELANGDRVRERKIGGGVNLEYPIGQTWLGSLGLNYTRTSLRDGRGNIAKRDERGNPLSFSGKGIDDLVTFSFTATRDQRDSPVNPSQGSLLSLSTQQSIPIGLGSIFSNRLTANYAQFVPVDLIKARDNQFPQVVAFNVQSGTVIGDLPPYDAFTLGGVNTVRGYGLNDVSASRSYFLASAEYRFPVYRFIGGVVFADFGSDLGSSDDVLGEPGIQRGRPGNGFGYGLGLRVNSPIGIVRLDFGINDQSETRFHFGFGQKF